MAPRTTCCLIFLALACARPKHAPPSSPDTHGAPDAAEASRGGTAEDQPRVPEPVNEVICLELSEGPVPPCSKSGSAVADLLPLTGASYVDLRGDVLEVGGQTTSARWPQRADKADAAFATIEGGRVRTLVREPSEIRARFAEKSGQYRLLTDLATLILWRDEGATLDLGASMARGARLVTFSGGGSERVYVAYEGDEASGHVVRHTSVRVTAGPTSEWEVLPWQALDHAASPSLHVTERGVLLTVFDPPAKDAEPALRALRLSEPGEAHLERIALAGSGWQARQLGDVARSQDRWITVAAVESQPAGASAVCAKPAALPPPAIPSPYVDPGFSGGPQPGQGGLALGSHGPKGSQTLILETGLAVDPGHLLQLSSTRATVSFCTQSPGVCYVAVVPLDEGEGALCSTGSRGFPRPTALDGESIFWVEKGLRTFQLNSAASMKGVGLRPTTRSDD